MKIIQINKHIIGSNNKTGGREPPVAVRGSRSGKAEYFHEVHVAGPCRIVYSPDKPLKCGAKVWIETEAEVVGFCLETSDSV